MGLLWPSYTVCVKLSAFCPPPSPSLNSFPRTNGFKDIVISTVDVCTSFNTCTLWFCVALATVGLYLLCIKEGFSIGKGDLLVLFSAFGYAIHILVIDYFSPKADGVKMSGLQFFVCGVISIPFMIILETIDWSNIFDCWLPILYSGVMSCGVAYTLQIVAQKNTEPTVASLILSLESVFALLAGMILLSEKISVQEAVGCIIMFSAIVLAQLPSKKEKPVTLNT